MPIFSSKNKEGQRSVNFSHFDGLPGYQKDWAINATLDETELVIKPRLGKLPTISLNYSQIVNVGIVSERDIIESNKSVVGRAVIGGIILGPVGAIVGGMSGTGKKTKSVPHNLIVLNYTPSDAQTNEVKVLAFEVVGASLGWDKFLKELKEKCGIIDPPPVSEIKL